MLKPKKLDKKAVELTMQTVVIAILMLIILGVLIWIFTGEMGKSSGKYSDIREKIGQQAEKAIENLSLGEKSSTSPATTDYANSLETLNLNQDKHG